MHQHYGNLIVEGALRGEGGALGELVHATAALSASDLDAGPGAGGLDSNAAMLRLLRRQGRMSGGARGETLPERDDPRLRHLGRGGGAPLPDAVRERMEAAFEHDFSHVRVHIGAQDATAAEAINARAFSMGPDLYFAAGQFAPGTPQGAHLLAHELTHVVQHDEGRVPRAAAGKEVSDPADALEQEAERVAHLITTLLGSSGLTHAALATPEASLDAVASTMEEPAQAGFEGGPAQAEAPAAQQAAPAEDAPAMRLLDTDEERDEENEGELTPEQRRMLDELEAKRETEGGAMEEAADEVESEQEEAPESEEASEEEESEEEMEEETPESGEEDSLLEETPGAGTAALPETLPAGTSGPANPGQSVELDPLVDHYMKVHWDQADLHAKTAEFNAYPDAIATETDRWLPVNTPPAVRAGANLLVGLGAGLLDATFAAFAKSIPGIGAIAELVYGVKDGWKNASTALKNNDPWGAAFEVIRSVIDVVGGVSGNLADLFTTAAQGAHVLAPFTAAVSEVVGVPCQAIAATLSAVQGFCTGALVSWDVFLLGYNYVSANREEAINGPTARAAYFRGQARASLFRSVESIIKAAAAWVSAGTGGLVQGAAPGNFGELMVQSGQKFMGSFGGIVGDSGLATAGGVMGRGSGPLDQLAGLSQGYKNLLAATGFGDAMERSADGFMGGHYIDRRSLAAAGTEAALMIGAARDTTLDDMNSGWDSLQAENPLWHQEVINKFLAPPSGVGAFDVLNIATSPSEWIRLQFAGMRYVLTALGDGGLEAIAGVASLAESALTNIAQPFVDNINSWMAENKPKFDEWLQGINERLQETTISLETIRNLIDQVSQMSSSLSTVMDQGGSIDQTFNGLIERINGMQISGESLGIPDWVPSRLYQWVLDGINSTITRGATMVADLKDRALEVFDEKLTAVSEWIDGELEDYQEAFSEGGEIETLLNEQLAQAQTLFAQFTETVTSWDGQLDIQFDGAADWLMEVARTAQEATSTAKQDRWKEYIQTTAQVYVTQWKARHAHEVEENYHPYMPAHELAAVDQAYDLLRENFEAVLADPESPHYDAAQERMQELVSAYAACTAYVGSRGRDSLHGLWQAEERLARIGLLPLPPAPEETEEETVNLDPVSVFFAYDRPRGSDKGMVDSSQLRAAVSLAQRAESRPLTATGHASVEGSPEYNSGLAQRRADAVAESIRGEVSTASVSTASRGEDDAGQDQDEYTHERWRRVDVTVGA
ncbi:MAG: DUF4157 domain-containing protein [Alphaproteobacteria bacterium]|nr:DUF4157 domain-containing protein [Alphaproteobacteria bacterium]MCB9792325.1 DUF4157 domain-containing protein [Alphaproteobacteria bacterium]